eukprot:gene14517-17137_t
MTTLQVRVKFPADYPVIYKTIRLQSTQTVQEAIAAIGLAINVNPAPDIGLYLPDAKSHLQENQLLSSFEGLTQAS